MVIKESNVTTVEDANNQAERVLQACNKLKQEFNSLVSVLNSMDKSELSDGDRWFFIIDSIYEDMDDIQMECNDWLCI